MLAKNTSEFNTSKFGAKAQKFRCYLLNAFDKIAFTPHQAWLERWYDYKTTDWANKLEYPEFTNKEVKKLLEL